MSQDEKSMLSSHSILIPQRISGKRHATANYQSTTYKNAIDIPRH